MNIQFRNDDLWIKRVKEELSGLRDRLERLCLFKSDWGDSEHSSWAQMDLIDEQELIMQLYIKVLCKRIAQGEKNRHATLTKGYYRGMIVIDDILPTITPIREKGESND